MIFIGKLQNKCLLCIAAHLMHIEPVALVNNVNKIIVHQWLKMEKLKWNLTELTRNISRRFCSFQHYIYQLLVVLLIQMSACIRFEQ